MSGTDLFVCDELGKGTHGMRGFNVTYPYNGHRGLVAAGLAGFGCRSSTYGVVWRYG